MDVILGAICFKLNEKDKLKTEGENKVGKRTLLKLKLYKHINVRIREVYPNFNIGITTLSVCRLIAGVRFTDIGGSFLNITSVMRPEPKGQKNNGTC